MCKRFSLLAAVLVVALSACATPKPPPGGLTRAGAESRLLEAIGVVPAISVIFDEVASRRMLEGRSKSADSDLKNLMLIEIEREKPQLARAFAKSYSTEQIRDIVAFMESEEGRPFGRVHAQIIQLVTIATARGVKGDRVDALSQDAMERFWAAAPTNVRNATDAFLNSPSGRAWSDGLDGALSSLLNQYLVVLTNLVLELRRDDAPADGADPPNREPAAPQPPRASEAV